MRTIVKIVPVLLALALLGCPGEARFRIAFEGQEKLEKDLSYECTNGTVNVKLGTNCYREGEGGVVTLHVKVKNKGDRNLYYDWRDASALLEPSTAFASDSVGQRAYTGQDWLSGPLNDPIPPDGEWTLDVRFRLDSWSVDSGQNIVHLKPGRLIEANGLTSCELPAIFGDVNNMFNTPFRR